MFEDIFNKVIHHAKELLREMSEEIISGGGGKISFRVERARADMFSSRTLNKSFIAVNGEDSAASGAFYF